MDSQKHAREVMRVEAEAIKAMADRLGESFDLAVETILHCSGRVIVTGMGKSGHIARKIVATFNSTGTSAFFLHPAEALHGDLGLIQPNDILMALSKSGQINELGEIIAAARRLGVEIIVLGGTVESDLFRRADIGLDCSVAKEACPNNLVPTSSSTAALVMGDAIAIALLRARNFSAEDFATLHPGGFIGRRLVKRVSEVHHTGDEVPLVSADMTLSEMMLVMTAKRLGCAMLTNDDGSIDGIFTDGDLRRLWEKVLDKDLIKMTADDVMTRGSKAISQDAVLDAALALMEKYAITQLPTVDDENKLVGIIHLHDILKSKLV